MPKAHEIKEKYINGILVDKENDTCFFNDETHAYYDKQTMERYTSVTTMIHSYTQPFDAAFWSAYKALEGLLDDDTFFQIKGVLLTKKKIDYNWLFSQINIDKILLEQKIKEILNSYDKAKDDSCVIGSAIHLEKELSFYGKKDFNMSKYGFDEVCGEFRCEQNYYKLDLDRGVYPEFMISCDIDGLKISGQIDLLIKDGNDIWLIDWKSNKEIKKTSYYDRFKKKHQMMKFPLSNLMDTNYWHYTMQLSTYMYLLQKIKPELNCKGLMLIHIDKETRKETKYPVEYLKDDVERMLKHFKKQQKIKSELDKIKPIELCSI